MSTRLWQAPRTQSMWFVAQEDVANRLRPPHVPTEHPAGNPLPGSDQKHRRVQNGSETLARATREHTNLPAIRGRQPQERKRKSVLFASLWQKERLRPVIDNELTLNHTRTIMNNLGRRTGRCKSCLRRLFVANCLLRRKGTLETQAFPSWPASHAPLR